MMFGLFLVVASGLAAGHLARSYLAEGRPSPLRSGWVVSLVGALIGAGLDILTKIWTVFGAVSPQQAHAPVVVCTTAMTYVAISSYITMASYYGRFIPFTVRSHKRRRP